MICKKCRGESWKIISEQIINQSEGWTIHKYTFACDGCGNTHEGYLGDLYNKIEV